MAPSKVAVGDITGDGQAEIIGTWSTGIWYWNPTNSCGQNEGCPWGQYCELSTGCSCPGKCTIKPGVCIQVYDPVCGCDNVDYPNECVTNMAGVSVKKNGTCSIVCSKNSDCGTDAWVNGTSCINNDVYDVWRAWTCTAGTCSKTDTSKLKQDCLASSCDVWNSVNYCKADGNLYHNRWCYDRGCLNAACFENKRAEEEKVQTCANGCANGKCSPPISTCTDSDGGLNRLVKGNTTAVNGVFTDKCYEYANYLVWDYYCAGVNAYPALLGCYADESCVDGACVKNVCIDSDGGMNPKVKGTNDRCYEYSNALIWEWYCYAPLGKGFQVLLACGADETCVDGACKKNICTDTDGGMTVGVKGTTTDYLGAKTDSCYQYSNLYVWENYCYAPLGKQFQALLYCGYGKTCVNGACI
jgi:hypothetical protein